MRRATPLLAGAILVFNAGCGGSGSRPLTLQVISAEADGTETPVASAYVRVIPMTTSPVPLPINSATLEELGGIEKDADFTDDHGRVTLDVTSKRPFDVEVAEPLMVENPTGRVWAGSFDPATGTLTPRREVGSLRVRVLPK